jgi:UDP-N-acetylmuramoyl-tripeptide--D-alanyl-D-alanine ligase
MQVMTTLAEVQTMLPESTLLNISAQDAQAVKISRVGTDSRQVEIHELFLALAGERFDAHDFLSDVVKAGATAAIVSNKDK